MVRSAAESGFEDSSSPDVMKAGIGTKSAELRRGICLHRNCALVQLLFSRRLQLRLPCGALSVWAMLLSGWRTQLHADDALIPLSFRCPARGTHAAVPASLLAAGHAYTPTRASAAAHLDPSPRNRLRRGSSQLLRVDFAPAVCMSSRFSREKRRSHCERASVLSRYRSVCCALSQKRSLIIAGSPCFFVRPRAHSDPVWANTSSP